MRRLLVYFGLALLISMGATSGWAHDVSVSWDFGGVGDSFVYEFEHEDGSDATGNFKGFLYFTATNTGNEAWGDFHLSIFESRSGYDVANVFFTDSSSTIPGPGEDPTWSRSNDDLTWEIVDGGHSLDLFFYSNPVDPGEQVTFSVYTDNTIDTVSFFGLAAYPTPVPVPAAVWLLGSGLLSLMGLHRKK